MYYILGFYKDNTQSKINKKVDKFSDAMKEVESLGNSACWVIRDSLYRIIIDSDDVYPQYDNIFTIINTKKIHLTLIMEFSKELRFYYRDDKNYCKSWLIITPLFRISLHRKYQ